MNVKVRMTAYENSDAPFIEIENHWSRNGVNGWVNIICDGRKYTISSSDLRKAIESCTGL